MVYNPSAERLHEACALYDRLLNTPLAEVAVWPHRVPLGLRHQAAADDVRRADGLVMVGRFRGRRDHIGLQPARTELQLFCP